MKTTIKTQVALVTFLAIFNVAEGAGLSVNVTESQRFAEVGQEVSEKNPDQVRIILKTLGGSIKQTEIVNRRDRTTFRDLNLEPGWLTIGTKGYKYKDEIPLPDENILEVNWCAFPAGIFLERNAFSHIIFTECTIPKFNEVWTDEQLQFLTAFIKVCIFYGISVATSENPKELIDRIIYPQLRLTAKPIDLNNGTYCVVFYNWEELYFVSDSYNGNDVLNSDRKNPQKLTIYLNNNLDLQT